VTASVKPPLVLKKRKLSSLQLRLPNFSLGSIGEQRAQRFLIAAGYQVLGTNVRWKLHEVDIIAFDPKVEELVFCEVKTRTSAEFGDPSLAVSKRKISSLNRVAQVFISRHKLKFDYRIDVLSVLPDGIEHYKNVSLYGN
jgi:putative endonuclease